MDNELIHNGQFNIGHICTKQQCEKGLQDKVAMRFISQALERTDYTFGDIERNSNRFANALLGLGLSEEILSFPLENKCTYCSGKRCYKGSGTEKNIRRNPGEIHKGSSERATDRRTGIL